MRKDAEAHAEDDKSKREIIDMKNSSDHLAYTTEKFLSENASTIPEKDKVRLNAIIDRLKSARDKEDAEGMKKAQEELQKVSQEVGKAMYEKAAASGEGPKGGPGAAGDKGPAAAGRPSGGEKNDDNVIDADYEVKS